MFSFKRGLLNADIGVVTPPFLQRTSSARSTLICRMSRLALREKAVLNTGLPNRKRRSLIYHHRHGGGHGADSNQQDRITRLELFAMAIELSSLPSMIPETRVGFDSGAATSVLPQCCDTYTTCIIC